MRVNIYAEEMTERIQIISKKIEGRVFTGLRFFLELPVTIGGPAGEHRSVDDSEKVHPPVNGKTAQVAGPFMHHPGDDDSSAVTFWGKRDLRKMLRQAQSMLNYHYDGPQDPSAEIERVARSLCAGGYHCQQCRDGNTCGNARDVEAAILVAVDEAVTVEREKWESWVKAAEEHFGHSLNLSESG